MTAHLSTTQWLNQLTKGDTVYLSGRPDALPSQVVEIDNAARVVLVAPVGPGGVLGMPMRFQWDDLGPIATADQAHWSWRR